MSVSQDLGDALQQLGQQLVEREVAERGVGDALERLEQCASAVARSRSYMRGVLDRHRRAVGGELEQLRVVGGERRAA